MKKRFVIAFLLASVNLYAQNFQKDINDQVWKPFVKAFNAYDADAFLAVHSKDLVRSPRDSKGILTWDEYLGRMREGDNHCEPDERRTLDLRFTERIANTKQAVEVGIYRTTLVDGNGKSRSFYGRFHVVLRKEDNVWKILVDMDSSEGGTIGEKAYLAASPLE